MADYRLDEVEKPERPAARDRLYCGRLGGVGGRTKPSFG